MLNFINRIHFHSHHGSAEHRNYRNDNPNLIPFISFRGSKHGVISFRGARHGVLRKPPWCPFSINSSLLVLFECCADSMFFSYQPSMKKLAKDAFCSWVRAYAAHRGELKRIFMVKKLHLGHVARSFALKEQPSLVGRSFQQQLKKRKRDEKRRGGGQPKKRKASIRNQIED